MAHGRAAPGIAASLVARGKGILAADETVPTLTRRFDALRISSTEQARRNYRKMLFTFPAAAEFISGVILQDETIRQKGAAGVPLRKCCRAKGSCRASRSIPAPGRWRDVPEKP